VADSRSGQLRLACHRDDRHLVWSTTLIIQRAEHRDTQAIHAKLDELLRAEGRARSELTLLDDEEPEVIEAHRAQERSDQN